MITFGMTTVYVVSRYHPIECFSKTVGSYVDVNCKGDGENNELVVSRSPTNAAGEEIALDEILKINDEMDDFNHPRRRRALILRQLYQRCKTMTTTTTKSVATKIYFETPASAKKNIENDNDDYNPMDLYRKVHSQGLMTFLSTAWKEWEALGQNGRDPSCIPFHSLLMEDDSSSSSNSNERKARIPPLIPCNFPLPREHNGGSHHPQRSSKNVMGKIGYYCTDTCTPIISELVEELISDASTVSAAVDIAINHRGSGNKEKEKESTVVYALCTHPGHHASHDSFGGYCYVNNAALAARLLQERVSISQLPSTANKPPRVAILDVDYHCGNGTASIFYNDPTVLVVSIHCHPDFDYPFHTGFGDETGGDDAKGCTLHVPLLPGTTWHGEYQTALLDRAGKAISSFNPDAFVLSLGLDTYIDDPCAIRRAGFKLKGRDCPTSGSEKSDDNRNNNSNSDYDCMGRAVGEIIVGCSNERNAIDETRRTIPTIVLQEGGYEMNAVPSAAADVLLGMAAAMGNVK